KFFQRIFGIALFSLFIVFGYKFYAKMKSVMKLSKTLPDYLKNIFGEKPRMNLNMTFNSLEIKLIFSKETLAKEDDLENTVLEYIEDFYPALSLRRLNIDIEAEEVETEDLETKGSEDKTEKEETREKEDKE
ncbi:MAG: hypothetical protein U9N34_04380, partial [Candidatus Cloacimonadota bacterium]|nr:hypothetical protein [Candidatus Cloacimonadota bacterium]